MISFSLSNGVFQANMKSIPVSQDTLRARLMVGLLPLKEAIGVRIPGPQLFVASLLRAFGPRLSRLFVMQINDILNKATKTPSAAR